MKLLQIFLLNLLLVGCMPSPVEPTATAQPSTAVATLAGTDTPIPGLTSTAAITNTPSPMDDPVLVGAGDIAHCSSNGDEATAAILDRIEGTVFTTGDNVYRSGTAEEFANCYQPSWGRHKERTYPSPGNHDYGTGDAAGYYQYFGSRAGDPTKGYYSYDLGTWHIIVLNSNIPLDAGSPQEQWLREDLAAHPVACTLAYWHHPRFSSGVQHGSDLRIQPLWQALYDFGADVVLAGHEHNYERFALQNPQGVADPARGIRQFVIGSGGRSHYSFGPPIDNSEVRQGDTYGVLKLTLHSGSYTWEFVPEAGQTFTDSGNEPCVTL
jgi:acid phosphatase type 7